MARTKTKPRIDVSKREAEELKSNQTTTVDLSTGFDCNGLSFHKGQQVCVTTTEFIGEQNTFSENGLAKNLKRKVVEIGKYCITNIVGAKVTLKKGAT